MVTNRQLAKIATYGAVGVISAAMYMQYKIKDRVRNTDYFRQAFKILRAHSGAVSLLGEPIKESNFDLGDEKKCFCDGKVAQFEVKVRGPKDRGSMFFWAQRNESGWLVHRVELELINKPEKRLLVKNDPNVAVPAATAQIES